MSSKKYFIIENGKQLGPFEISELIERNIQGDTLIWTQNLKNWIKASEISELNEFAKLKPPPLPINYAKRFIITVQLQILVLFIGCCLIYFIPDAVWAYLGMILIIFLLNIIFNKNKSLPLNLILILPLIIIVGDFILLEMDHLSYDNFKFVVKHYVFSFTFLSSVLYAICIVQSKFYLNYKSKDDLFSSLFN